MKKMFNKRPIVLFALCLLIMVYTLLYLSFKNNKLIFGICFSVLFVIGVVLYLLIKNNKVRYCLSRVCIICLAVITATSAVTICESLYNRDKFSYDGYAVVSARVADSGEMYQGNYRKLLLDRATISTPDFTKSMNYKISVVVICDDADESIFTVGNFLDITCKLSSCDLFYQSEFGLTFTYYNKHISAYGYATEDNITVLDKNAELTISERIKDKVTKIVSGAVDQEYQGIALGMLFGDKLLLDDDIKSNFNASGIAHLLAVSGLHVGFLVALLVLFLKLLKIKGIYKFIITAVILIFYCYLCGFSVSVVRATIMAICSLYAGFRYKKYDSLNAISIALVFCLLINPFSASTIGFKLSFMAVYGIVLLAKPLARGLSKIFKAKMANTISVLLAVQISTTFVIASYFNNITLVGIISNFVCIPIASLAYMILFITVVISLIIPALSFTVYLFQFIMQAIVKFTHLIAQVNMVYISSSQAQTAICLTIGAMTAGCDYIFYNQKIKMAIVGGLLLAIIMAVTI